MFRQMKRLLSYFGRRPFSVHLGALKIICFHSFQRNGDHRKFSHVFFTESGLFRDGKSVEELWVAAIRKETVKHTHVQGFFPSVYPEKRRSVSS